MTGCSNPSDWFFLVYMRLTVHGTESVWLWRNWVGVVYSSHKGWMMVINNNTKVYKVKNNSIFFIGLCLILVVPVLLKALLYNERKGSCSVGKNTRFDHIHHRFPRKRCRLLRLLVFG